MTESRNQYGGGAIGFGDEDGQDENHHDQRQPKELAEELERAWYENFKQIVSNAQKKASVNRQQMRSNYNRHQSNYGGSLHTSVRGSVYGGDNESSMPIAQSV